MHEYLSALRRFARYGRGAHRAAQQRGGTIREFLIAVRDAPSNDVSDAVKAQVTTIIEAFDQLMQALDLPRHVPNVYE